MTVEIAIAVTIGLSIINNIWFKIQFDKEQKLGSNWRIGTVVGAFIFVCLGLWTIYLFWFLSFKSAVICTIIYLVLSYALEKMFGFNKISNLKKPWIK